MQQAISVLTLGVDDLDRALAFYRDGLGFTTQGIVGAEFENGAVAFFKLDSGMRLALWPRKSLAADTGLPLREARASAISIGHNVASDAEVDAVIALAQKAGATIVKPPHTTFYGGYAAYFLDPDGHLWEVVHVHDFEALG